MNFFKSVFTDPPEQDEPTSPDPDPNPSPNPHPDETWTFGTLMKTLATKSETVIQNYRRDLEELSVGLKKETDVIRKVASRAVTDLPDSLEVGASVAQHSLESVGQAIDDIGASVWESTAKIISHGKDTLLAVDDDDGDDGGSVGAGGSSSSSVGRYSRFDVQLRNLQSDVGTYCEDLEGFAEWRDGFVFDEEREREIEELVRENDVVRRFYRELVPEKVDRDSFWCRYFYRVCRLKEAEKARAELVRRAMSGGEEEDLSWDVDDDEDEEEQKEKGKGKIVSENADAEKGEFEDTERSEVTVKERGSEVEVKSEAKGDNSDSCKDSDVSIVSSQPSMPEDDDLGWDEIEDVESNDDNKVEVAARSSRAQLHKRLSAADAEEDLSWDIEDDDDETVKS